MHKVKSRRRVSLTKWKKFRRNGRILSTRYYVTRPFRNSMPNRMFIINRLSGMAYEGLSDSSAVPRRVGGTRKMECLRLPLIWRHVFAASHSPISFSRLNRKKENGTNALYVLVGTRILEGRTTRRDENSVENTDCATHVCPSNLSIALGGPRWFVACKASSVSRIFYDAYIYIYHIDRYADESMLPFANIIFVPVFRCFSFCFSFFFFLDQIYIPVSKRNFISSRVISVSLLTGTSLLVSILSVYFVYALSISFRVFI